MKNKTQLRQGDLLIERIKTIPTTAKKQDDKVIVLAHGEATGHAHTIKDRDAADWWKTPDEQFVEVKEATEVVHQEHSAVALAPGPYRIARQKEYTAAAIRNVAD